MARLCYNTPHQIMQKLYCYVDETGQDTEGRFFLVVVVIADAAITEALKKQLLDIERDVGKQRSRWAQNRLQVRIAYLERICSLPELQDRVWYAVYRNIRDYIALTAQTITRALQQVPLKDYRVTIEVDGFNKAELDHVRRALKTAKIRYDKLRGPRDESQVFLRLADALAGFLRDSQEGQPYTKNLLSQFEQRQLIKRIP
jgi:hypothetical protein